MIARHIRVIGKVQGVFFRASTKTMADELNIKGFVRNERDGSVYIEAEGDDENMTHFLTWCKQGPQRASVDRLDVVETNVVGYRDFSVQR